MVAVEGPDHDRVFRVAVSFDGQVLGTGEGRNKKAAEQRAAEAALETLERGQALPGSADS